MTTNIEIIEALETLAAACPWDNVEIDVKRTPEGQYTFSAWVPQNEKFGFDSAYGFGDTPSDAAQRIIADLATHPRDPEESRKRKIKELREQISKLQAVVIGLPPYRPNRELAQSNGKVPRVPPTIDL